MKRLVVSALALAVVLGSPVLAQSPDAASESRIRADVTFLADDAIEGRQAGRRGYDLAALYMRTRMEAMGLQPGGPNGAWLQPVTLTATRVADGATMTFTPASGSPVVWANGVDVAVTPGVDAGHVAQAADLVFVGYGLSAPDMNVDDYAGLDVRGKIVVVLSGLPTGMSGETGAFLSDTKKAAASAHGAVGMITVLKSDQMAAGFTRAVGGAARQARRSWAGADGRPFSDAPGLAVQATLTGPAADALFAGAPKSYADLRAEAAAEGARPTGFPLGGAVAFDVTTTREDTHSANVIGLIPGSDPALRDQVVMLTAHLDHLGMRETGEDKISNGALDNAGGVAIMLEAARQLAANPPRRSVMVVGLTAEEMGLLGSEYLAQNPVVAADRVVANVNLDMPILTYDFADLVAFGSDHSTLGPVVDAVARSEGLVLAGDPFPEQGVFTRSDHYSFVKAGVPSVMLATGYANGGEAQWDRFFEHGYHQPNDDLSQDFHWNAAVRFARINAAIARSIADGAERPMWFRGDIFGDRFAPGAPRADKPAP